MLADFYEINNRKNNIHCTFKFSVLFRMLLYNIYLFLNQENCIFVQISWSVQLQLLLLIPKISMFAIQALIIDDFDDDY